MNSFYFAPTPQEIGEHLKQAMTWQQRQPVSSKAPLILIYAWNENDEGGWLIPTYPCDTDRIEALHDLLGDSVERSPGCKSN